MSKLSVEVIWNGFDKGLKPVSKTAIVGRVDKWQETGNVSFASAAEVECAGGKIVRGDYANGKFSITGIATAKK